MKKTAAQKLTLKTTTVRLLNDHLRVEELRNVVGGQVLQGVRETVTCSGTQTC